ncbi:MAG: DVU0524 family FlgM-associated protein [Desulfobacterales bacterium]
MKFFIKFFIGSDNKTKVKNMVISAYQVNNVLRVYGDQLRQSMICNRSEGTDTNTPDKISISAKTRRETIIDDIISNIIERITQFGPHDNVEKEVFKKLESEHGKPLAINEDRHNELIFKEINGKDETINSLSIEDSKFLTNKLVVKK